MDAFHAQWVFSLTPFGCRNCGIRKGDHYQRWTQGIGWHLWTMPTERQLKNRMRVRRNYMGAYRWR